jgi:2-polyprenyl-6-methoxyphenol hydroxylase-like FAD-dependent oxidoreductase
VSARKVLVVGAGVADLAVARALRGSGTEVEIVERTAMPDCSTAARNALLRAIGKPLFRATYRGLHAAP